MDFSNKTALITGAGQGVGEGIARALASYGANVSLVGRTLSKVQLVSVPYKQRTSDRCINEEVSYCLNIGIEEPKYSIIHSLILQPTSFFFCVSNNVNLQLSVF